MTTGSAHPSQPVRRAFATDRSRLEVFHPHITSAGTPLCT